MTFTEQINALKERFKSKLTDQSTPEEIQEVNDVVKELEDIETAHNVVATEHAKFKDTIVRMVTTQGDSNKPRDDTDGSKPKTIEECVAEELAKQEK